MFTNQKSNSGILKTVEWRSPKWSETLFEKAKESQKSSLSFLTTKNKSNTKRSKRFLWKILEFSPKLFLKILSEEEVTGDSISRSFQISLSKCMWNVETIFGLSNVLKVFQKTLCSSVLMSITILEKPRRVSLDSVLLTTSTSLSISPYLMFKILWVKKLSIAWELLWGKHWRLIKLRMDVSHNLLCSLEMVLENLRSNSLWRLKFLKSRKLSKVSVKTTTLDSSKLLSTRELMIDSSLSRLPTQNLEVSLLAALSQICMNTFSLLKMLLAELSLELSTKSSAITLLSLRISFGISLTNSATTISTGQVL